MRRFAIGSMLVIGLMVGCDKPDAGIPAPEGSTGAVSSGDDLSVEMPKKDEEKAATDAAAPAEAKPAETPAAPAGDAAPAATPAAEPAAPAATETPKQSSVTTFSGAKFVSNTSIKVPTMSCPHGCWPTVKETLAAQPGVEAVELAKQKDADSIDNPVVYIKLNGKFDAQAATSALAKAGFAKAEVVN